jgi:NADPH:quinone reductase-like Zn-dependent oxidoreductase
MPKAVRYAEFGGIDVLRVDEVERPVPGDGQVLVRVKAAGINPSEAVIRTGALAKVFPSTFPSGQGSDLAGIIEEVGAGVGGFSPGDEVIGFTQQRASQAELVLVEVGDLTRKPEKVSWEVAGGLYVAGVTAWGAVHAVHPKEGETVVISGAAGGVGSLAVQIARRTGATVIGLASAGNHEWLKSHGVIPVAYGDGVADRIRAVAPSGADAFIDTHGDGYVELALALGVAADRIDTIADFAAAEKYGVKTDGGTAAGPGAIVLAELAGLIADGHLEVPIANVYPLAQVRAAYTELERRHTHGKIAGPPARPGPSGSVCRPRCRAPARVRRYPPTHRAVAGTLAECEHRGSSSRRPTARQQQRLRHQEDDQQEAPGQRRAKISNTRRPSGEVYDDRDPGTRCAHARTTGRDPLLPGTGRFASPPPLNCDEPKSSRSGRTYTCDVPRGRTRWSTANLQSAAWNAGEVTRRTRPQPAGHPLIHVSRNHAGERARLAPRHAQSTSGARTRLPPALITVCSVPEERGPDWYTSSDPVLTAARRPRKNTRASTEPANGQIGREKTTRNE